MRIFILLVLLVSNLAAAGAESGYDATYRLKLGPVSVGEMRRTYRMDADGAYRFESEVRATGLASFMRRDELFESSAGSYRNGAYYPARYTYERKNKRKPRSVATVFDRENATIETIYNGEVRTAELDGEVLDKLVYQAQIMRDLAAGKTTLRYPVTDRGRRKVYAPVIEGKETVETDAGTYETVKVVRNGNSGKKRTIFWCAPSLGFLPVKVAHREKNGNETIVTLETVAVY